MKGFSIKCDGHTYITLKWNGRFVFCLDNDTRKAEEMIYLIQKRTRMNFHDIPIEGDKEDFVGICFENGGWKRNLWENFPTKQELESYMKTKYGTTVIKEW